MIRFIKDRLKHFLYECGYEILWTRKDHVSGTQLTRDLPLLLPAAGAVCLDVGANTGQTLELLTEVLREPQIHSFEPTPAVFADLEKKTWGPNVHLHRIALGSKSATTSLNLYEFSVLNSLLPLDNRKGSPFSDVSGIGTTIVNVSTLDDFVAEQSIDFIDLLKIDTQGYDLEVLKGGQRIFHEGRVGHVLVELNYINLYGGQCSPSEIESYLASYGFRLVDLYEIFRSNQAISWCTALFKMAK